MKYLADSVDLIGLTIQNLVQRILKELSVAGPLSDSQKNALNKLWNAVRTICAIPDLYPKCLPMIESGLLPVFALMKDPQNFFYDDEILFIVNSLMRMNHTVTLTMQELFTTFPGFLEKNKNNYGNLFSTINRYLIDGQVFFSQNSNALDIVSMLITTHLEQLFFSQIDA